MEHQDQTNAPGTRRLRAWLRLCRPPNLFTVPGDPIAGCILAGLGAGTGPRLGVDALLGAGASVLLYCAGLIQNDCFDLAEDRAERPDRPLPSGHVAPQTAAYAAAALFLAGVAVATAAAPAAGVVASGLALCITFYNSWAKRVPVLGPLAMGMCRGMSLILGWAVVSRGRLPSGVLLGSAALWVTYIAAVTQLASAETRAFSRSPIRWLPAAALVAWTAGVALLSAPTPLARAGSLLLGIVAVCWALRCGAALSEGTPPPVVQRTVGRLIRGLILVQAAAVALALPRTLPLVCLLLLAWPVSARLAKRFYAS